MSLATDERGPFVIAEAGVNHNGDLGRAREMIAVAAQAGADVVKFQAFDPEGLVAAGTGTAAYQRANTGLGDQQAMLKSLALPLAGFEALAGECVGHGIEFLCTAFDVDAVERLLGYGMRRIKVASGELTNTPALHRFARLGAPIVLSTGMATLAEVGQAVAILRDNGGEDITLLHCTSLYPAPEDTVNLRAIVTLHEAFGLPVGYSDHTLGDHVAVAATALGATVIEKHFTLDRKLPGPDHAASLEPAELAAMIRKVRATARALGDGVKRPAAGEEATARLVRRSWHAARDLAAGIRLGESDLVLKRPANGLAPHLSPVGRKTAVAIAADQPITAEHLL
jgi:N-acetylneuraminate synthase/N,N'-diacetyllegionaminate synthase